MQTNSRGSPPSHHRLRLQRLTRALRTSAAKSGPLNVPAIARDLLFETGFGQTILARFGPRKSGDLTREYTAQLPSGYPAREIRIRLSSPQFRAASLAGFSDHALDAQGNPGNTAVAVMTGGFAISRDLGTGWDMVRVRDREFRGYQFVHMKSIGGSEFLVQAARERWRPGTPREITNLVVNETGEVLAAQRVNGSPWHGCRSAEIANGTLMYAEYPYEDPIGAPQNNASSRVFRSRDRGRSWEIAFERGPRQIRHFHFLQARPGYDGEWWLASGDHPSESRIWVSKDDGDSWEDITAGFGDKVALDGLEYPRTVFRLTDLVWEADGVLWGTDDYLARNKFPIPGARMFRSAYGDLAPAVAGKAKWPIRNIVDIGGFYLVLTQGWFQDNAPPEDKMPGVYLMPKERIDSAPDMVRLFNVEKYSPRRTGFTYSRASRAAKDGTFFTYRASTDAFPSGHKILKWEVGFS